MPAKTFPTKQPRGFALVVTLSLMILLTVIAVGLLSLSSISLRSSGATSAQATARANARMAMMLAIGQLQKSAGRDQSVTGPASLGRGGLLTNANWTGVWKSDDTTSTPTWLVSGESPDPATALTSTNSAHLWKKNSSINAQTAAPEQILRAEWVKVDSKSKGRFAYWVGDEGIKAKVDISKPTTEPTLEREKIARSQSPLETGIVNVEKNVFANFKPSDPTKGSGLDKRKLATMGTVALAATPSAAVTLADLPRIYLNDLTTGGYALPVNVRDGGMKADLSLVFDRSQQSKPFVRNFIGATPNPTNLASAKITSFTVSDPAKFYLSDNLRTNVAGGTGPNWGNLWNYARLWENISGSQIPFVGTFPEPQSDMVQSAWRPYSNHGNGTPIHSDTQHTNSGLAPVVSLIQMGFYLSASPAPDVTLPNKTIEKRYYADLLIKPVIGLWNPHNIKIASAPYKFDCAMLPYLRLDYNKRNADGSFSNGSGNVTEIWLRDEWLKKVDGSKGYETNVNSYMQLRTPSVDLEPGEFRLFSGGGTLNIADVNDLVPVLNPAGTFKLRIKRSVDGTSGLAVDKAGMPLSIPAGYYGWFGDIYLQDTQFPNTAAHIGTNIDPNGTASWFGFKAGGADTRIQRFTDIWNGGKDRSGYSPLVPEPIVSRRNTINVSNTSTRKVTQIERLVDAPAHAGTWRFSLRTSTDLASDPSQGLRGWIDSNPRAIASNLRFDGSNSSLAKRDGWNTISHLMGGCHGDTTKSIGDNQHVSPNNAGNRGLVAEGDIGRIFPEGPAVAGRWRMFGGGSSKSGLGQTNVIAYDVPRGPLTSIGQFQHAQLSRYNCDPGFVVGNSYANPRIPLDKTFNDNFNPNSPGGAIKASDISLETNTRIWDSAFFSTLAPDHFSVAASTYASAIDYKSMVAGTLSLPNPRMVFTPIQGDTGLEAIITNSGDRAPQAMAARIRIDGGFNVNSLSKTAWKAVLSSMGGSDLPIVTPATGAIASPWQRPEGHRFNRFSAPILGTAYNKGDGVNPSFWQGWRNLSETELDELADAIVTEVRTRGPFRSFADFVNRNPSSSEIEQQRKGALQAALDKTVNSLAAVPTGIGSTAVKPTGSGFSNAINGESQATGHAGYLLQGDVLQSLAPALQVRSDYFRIRTCGEAFAADGKTILATAYCEAFVQRVPAYVNASDKPEVAPSDLAAKENKTFGRRFELVSFRWLSISEI
jgi:Tfp pilus assembly protein PilX